MYSTVNAILYPIEYIEWVISVNWSHICNHGQDWLPPGTLTAGHFQTQDYSLTPIHAVLRVATDCDVTVMCFPIWHGVSLPVGISDGFGCITGGCDSVPVIWDSLLLARLTRAVSTVCTPASHANRNVTMIVFLTVELVRVTVPFRVRSVSPLDHATMRTQCHE